MFLPPNTTFLQIVSVLFRYTICECSRFFWYCLYLTRNLREARDNAMLEKDRAMAAERDVQSRYDQLLEQWVFPSRGHCTGPNSIEMFSLYFNFNIDRSIFPYFAYNLPTFLCLVALMAYLDDIKIMCVLHYTSSILAASLFPLWCWCVKRQQSVLGACCGCDRSLVPVVYHLLLQLTWSDFFRIRGLCGSQSWQSLVTAWSFILPFRSKIRECRLNAKWETSQGLFVFGVSSCSVIIINSMKSPMPEDAFIYIYFQLEVHLAHLVKLSINYSIPLILSMLW